MKRILTLILLALLLCNAHAYDAEVDGIYYNLTASNKTAEVTESAMGYYAGAIVIPDTITVGTDKYAVTAIGNKAFYENTTLTSVTLPSTITRIGNGAFNGCTALTSLTVPSSVDSIGNYAFTHSGITHKIIVGNMFAYMPDNYMGTYTIPDSIRRITSGAFAYCTGMTGVTLPDSLESIYFSAFGSCSTLASVTIPNSVTFIDGYAFNECASLASVKLPETLKRISECTFFNCVSLTKIDIPSTVTRVDRFAFSCCSSLARINCYAIDPPFAGQCAFDQISEYAALYIPRGTISLYKASDEWKTIPNIYEMGGVSVDNTTASSVNVFASYGYIMIEGASGLSVSVYSADGKLVTSASDATAIQQLTIPGSGIYFLRFSNGMTQRIVVK